MTARQEAEEALKRAKEDLEVRVLERTADLERRNEELGRANAELQDFAHIASHDLQEPLRKIQAFGDRVTARYADAIPEQGRDYLARMRNAAERMSVLIADLLELSRVTTKARPFTDVDLAASVAEVVSDLETRIEKTKGRVVVGELPVIAADRTQIRQLLQNLIGNAFKISSGELPARGSGLLPIDGRRRIRSGMRVDRS